MAWQSQRAASKWLPEELSDTPAESLENRHGWEWMPPVAPARERGPRLLLDLSGASLDQLCRAGLSVHQASGLIGRREQQGGYFSLEDLEELDGVYGIRRDQIDALKQAAGA